MGVTPLLVAVPGATGFIGTTLCTELLKSGMRVRALARDPGRAKEQLDDAVEIVGGDLADRNALDQFLRDADAVVHCAGAVRGSSQQQFDRTNVAGTQCLLQAMLSQEKPARLVLLSSLAAREPGLSWYANSKSCSEQLLWDVGSALNWIIVRPPPVYGPGDKEMLPVFRAMSRGLAPVPGEKSARISLIHVRDLVAALLACLGRTDMPATHYTLCDGQENGYDWTEMAALVGQVWGRRVRLLHIPRFVLDSFAAVNLALAKLLGYAPMLTPPKLRELRHRDWVVNNAKLRAEIDWQPRIQLHQGLSELREMEL